MPIKPITKKIITLALALCFVAAFSAVGVRLLTASHAATPYATPTGDGLSLHVVKQNGVAKLVNTEGKPVQLRGVDISGRCAQGQTMSILTNGVPVSTTIKDMKGWGINAVRIVMNEDCWLGLHGLPGGGLTTQTLHDSVAQLVDDLNQGGIYVIIDLHTNSPSNAPGNGQSMGEQVMADEDYAPSYWTSMAGLFKDDPAVIFEAYNEPHVSSGSGGNVTDSNPWDCWLNGCEATQYNYSYTGPKVALKWQTAGMQQLVNVIRQTGANNIVSLGGLGWSNNLSQWASYEPKDPQTKYPYPQLAASFHNYDGWACKPGSGTSDPNDCWDNVIAKVNSNTAPVLTTEFGGNRNSICTTANYPVQYMQWANQHNVSYTAWVWTPGTCGTGISHGDDGGWGLLKNWNAAQCSDLSTYGQPILAYVRGQSSSCTGTPPPQPTPTVALTAPVSGATVSGSVTVSATASIGSGDSIKSMTLKAGGTVLKTCSSATCTDTWDTTALTNGSVSLEADTTGSDGKTATATETVMVKNSHPVTISAPSNLSSPSQTTTSISLGWKASSDSKYPASKLAYQVLRNGTSIKTTAAGATTDSDAGLAPGTYYDYSVIGADPAGNKSVPSAALAIKTRTPPCAQPAAPTGLTAKAVSPTTVNLTWKAVSHLSSGCVITGYVVSRNAVPLAQPAKTMYTDSTATASTTYTYSVVAVETGNIAGKSASTKVTTPKSTAPDPGPSAPGNVVGTAVGSNQVNLTWDASSDPVTGIKEYEVLRDGHQVGTSTTTSFGDSGLSANTMYQYKVVAVSGSGKTATSAQVSVKTLSGSHGGGGGSGQGGGGSGGGNGGSGSSYVPPILQGTTSVGSGSDTGTSVSDNPTNPGSSTVSQLAQSQSSTAGKTKSLSTTQVAYLGTGGTLLVVVLGAAGWWWFRQRQKYNYQPTYDPDLTSHIVVGNNNPNDHGPYGPQPPYGPSA